jgi:aldose 1-epimerase
LAVTYPTGEQYEITSGDQWAVVTEVGATLRGYRVGDQDVVLGSPVDEPVAGGRGQHLIPWPNRIRDGRYPFGGADQQLALTEPDRHNAIHGLTRHVPWTLVEHTASSVTQSVVVYPQPGWPGILQASLTTTLSDDGLVVEVTATNIGGTVVPFGYGVHPYLTAGESRVDDLTLTLPVSRYLAVDDRLLPISVEDVAGTEHDLRRPAPLGARVFDTAFTGVEPDDDGRWRVRLEHGDRFAELWAEEQFGWLQLYTGADRRDIGLALEPMTCGPDAFNPGPTHDDVIELKPAEQFRGRWGVRGR